MGPARVELELLCLDSSLVAVALHVVVDGTPIRSFSSPACRNAPSPASLPRCASPTGAACKQRLEAAAAEGSGAAAAATAAGGKATTVLAAAAAEQQAAATAIEVLAVDGSSTADNKAMSAAHAPLVAGNGCAVTAAPPGAPYNSGCASGRAAVLQPASDPDEPASAPRTAATALPANGDPDSTPIAASQANRGGAAQGAVEAGVPAAASVEQQGGDGAGATLATMMGMLQRLLSTSSPAAVPQQQQQQQQPWAAPTPAPASAHSALVAPPSPTVACSRAGSGPALPGEDMQRLFVLELEVVQLQQNLAIAQMDFEARTSQLHLLKQRADAAEQRAQAADERAAGVERHLHLLERQLSDARCQMGEAAARHQQESGQHASRLAAAANKQHKAEEEAGRLRQQLEAARQAGEAEQAQLRRAAAVQQAEWQQQEAAQQADWQQRAALQQAQWQQREAAQQAQWQQRVAASRQEVEQLQVEVATACRTLRAMGIAPHKVFGQPGLLAAGVTDGMHSPPDSPVVGAAQQPNTGMQRRGLPPQVPRLQLSSISLQQLTAQASPKPPAAAGHGEHSVSPVIPSSSGAGSRAQLQPTAGGDRCADVGAAADGSARAAFSARAPPPVVVPSPTASVQQSCELNLGMLTARSRQMVSPAQQELLATARQWQLTARAAAAAEQQQEEEEENLAASRYYDALPSARTSARGPAPPLHGFGGGMAAAHASCTPRHHHTPRPPVGATPLRGASLRGTPLRGTPGGRLPLRPTYGQEPSFQDIKAAYHAVMSSETDRASKWARSVFSSTSAVDTDPARVDHMVQSLLQLFASNGVPIPLQKCGPCQYRLPGGAKLALRLVNGRLMARAGAGQTMDIFAWLEKQPVAQQAQQQRQHGMPY